MNLLRRILGNSRPSPNYERMAHGVYVVRTQAGFRNAVKEFAGREDTKRMFQEMRGYPKSYPSMVCLAFEYRGYHFVSVTAIPLTQVKEVLSRH